MHVNIGKIIRRRGWNPYSVFLVFLPAIVIFVLMALMTDQPSYRNLIPVWNDEVGWWGFIRNIVENINYPGHTGYNGEYAKIGNFGPWGVTPLLPYALIGKIFGWNLYSMSMANMFILGFGLFAFSQLVNADNRTILRIGILYFCTYISVGYTMTSMSESLRYSLTIILCGIVIFLSRKEPGNDDGDKTAQHRYYIFLVVSGLILLYAVNVWLILALFIPLFLWQVLRKCSNGIKLILIPLITVIISAIEQYTVGLVSYSYAESVFSKIAAEVKMGGVLAGVRFAISNMFANLETISLPNIIKNENNTLFMYFLLYLILVVISTVKVFREKSYRNFLVWYLLTGFLFGYCALYTGSGWTLCRGTNAGLFAAVLCACVFESNETSVNIRKIVYTAGLIGIVVSYDYFSGIITERVITAANTDLIIEEQIRLADVIRVSPDNDAWDNTVAEYGSVDYWYLAMPVGASGNYMLNGETNTKARYVIIRSGDGAAENVVNTHINNGYAVVLEDDIFIVLMRE